MKGISFFMAAVSTALMLAGCTMLPPPGSPHATILNGVNIVDVEKGTVTPPRAILIENGVIADIADRPGADWPRTALRPDVAGLYVSPALIDTHAHIFDERDLAMISTFGVAAMRNMDGPGT